MDTTECANTLKKKKLLSITMSDEDTSSDEGMFCNQIAFTIKTSNEQIDVKIGVQSYVQTSLPNVQTSMLGVQASQSDVEYEADEEADVDDMVNGYKAMMLKFDEVCETIDF